MLSLFLLRFKILGMRFIFIFKYTYVFFFKKETIYITRVKVWKAASLVELTTPTVSLVHVFLFWWKQFHDNSNNYASKESLAVFCPIKSSASKFGTLKGKSINVLFPERKCELPSHSQSKNCAVCLKFCTTFLFYSFSFYSKFDLNITVIRRNCFLKGLVTWLTDYMSIFIVS